MLTWTQGDSTPVTADEVDWSLFDPERVEHVKAKTAFAFEQGICTRGIMAGWLVTFHDKGKLSGRTRGGRSARPVDIQPAVSALAVLGAAKRAHEEAKQGFSEAIRAVYAEGATATSLHRELGLSLSRVNQLVAGARG